MEKSGQRAAHPEIIDKPELKSPFRCLLEGFITMTLMAVCVYWLVPAIAALLWYFAVELFHNETIAKGGFDSFLKIMREGGFIIVIVIGYKIIDKPELKTPFRYLIEGSVTLFLWSVWVYWVSPVLTAFLWFLGVRIFHSEIISKAGFAEFMEILRNGGSAVLVITFVMLVWIYYNYLWFLKRGERRNKEVMVSSDKDIARICNIDSDLLNKAKQKKRVEVHLKDDGITIK
jgi:poly-beta-1,6-N-acetyl-D-glucosamine biosynthesis protein PgaD